MAKVKVLDNSINTGWNVGDEVELEPSVALEFAKEGKVQALDSSLYELEKSLRVKEKEEVVKKKRGRPKKVR